MTEPSAPPQLSPDGKFYWDGQKWQPMPGEPAAAAPVATATPVQQPKSRRGLFGCLGVIALLILMGICVSAANSGTKPTNSTASTTGSNDTSGSSASTPIPTPTPVPFDPAAYKASAKIVPYPQLVKDPASMKGTVVAYRAKVFQYDARTTTSNMLVEVTSDQYGFWSDFIYLDLPGSLSNNSIVQGDVINVWGAIVGPYSYDTAGGGKNTVPEISVRIMEKSS